MVKLKREFKAFTLLLQSLPTTACTLFVISVFAMNLLANKSINLPFDWLALDCGILVSWFAFLLMDIVTKHFGPKAATELSVFATAINLLLSLVFFLCSLVPGVWGESFVEGSADIINNALNNTIGGTWYIILGSTVAFLASSVINNFTNWAIGKTFKKNPDNLLPYILRTYVSTAIGQFADNLIFALIVSHFFFGWTLIQCTTCALTGMVAELLCEAIFFYPGFKLTQRWKKNNVGAEYFAFAENKEATQ